MEQGTGAKKTTSYNDSFAKRVEGDGGKKRNKDKREEFRAGSSRKQCL